MLRKIKIVSTAAALIAAGVLVSGEANAQGGVKLGTLTCSVSSGFGFIFGSSRDVRCTFQSARGTFENYMGHISKFGVDIGYTRGGVIVWAVFAPSATLAPGALAGDYGGATAGATVGVGAAVHALVGGFRHSISLQPLSIEGNTGLNVAAGIAQMTLRPAPM